ncbi:MAG: UvrD-helicase domain-containing protein, partial [Lachnospiraceae bacterium]|nr:UvrD-helicase domain-containing protein [Lachnospiraceae bacterium]
MQLNKEQQAASLHKDGPALVLAGPGSGKTALLSRRIQNLLIHYHIPASQILVISFTRAASQETAQRFRQIHPEPAPVHFGTIHAVFYHILRISRPQLAWFVVPPHETEERFSQREEALSFEEILEKCLLLFQSEPEVLAQWQDRFRYLMVDEFQDTSPLQWRLIQMLAGPRANIFAVGDEDQSIYAFRGADSGLMLRYPREYPQAVLYRLTACYRFGPEILRAARSLIRHNRKRYAKKLKGLGSSGPKPVLKLFASPQEELKGMLKEVLEIRKQEPMSQTAVLLRSNYGLSLVKEAFRKAGLESESEKNQKPGGLWLMTMHGAKGLEFD